ncbi:MAG: hypothetical protein IJ895_01180 [Prevotella sp.]|nr:hypothetical protein [Prevotella sp.]
MVKSDGRAIINGGHIDASALKFLDEGLVMVSTHGGPATIAYLTVETVD